MVVSNYFQVGLKNY